MNIHIQADADEAAMAGAKYIAAEAWAAVNARGRFVMGVSGGHAPWGMFRALAGESVPWHAVHIVQVDERIAPAESTDRNLVYLEERLLAHVSLPASQIYPMPVDEKDLENAAASYAELLREIAGSPSVLDLVHLGLGPDGHTASLVPGDPVLDITDRDVALTGIYQDRRRMTLTYPILNRARCVLWLVTGAEKAGILKRLRDSDISIPASRIRQDRAVVMTDYAAANGSTN